MTEYEHTEFLQHQDGTQYTGKTSYDMLIYTYIKLQNDYVDAMCDVKAVFKALQLAYSGPGRIIDQIQLLNKEVNALLNEVEAQAKLVLKHQRKIQELEEKIKGLQNLEERRWKEFINWSVRFELKQEAYTLSKELKQEAMSMNKLVNVKFERHGKITDLIGLTINREL